MEPEIITLYFMDYAAQGHVVFILVFAAVVGTVMGMLKYGLSPDVLLTGAVYAALALIMTGVLFFINEPQKAAERWIRVQMAQRLDSVVPYDGYSSEVFYVSSGQNPEIPRIVYAGYQNVLSEAKLALEPDLGDIGCRPWITERSQSPDSVRARAEAFLKALPEISVAFTLIEDEGWYGLMASDLLGKFTPPRENTAEAWYRAFENAFDGSALSLINGSTGEENEENAERFLNFLEPYTFADECLLKHHNGSENDIQALAEKALDGKMIVIRTEFMRP